MICDKIKTYTADVKYEEGAFIVDGPDGNGSFLAVFFPDCNAKDYISEIEVIDNIHESEQA